MQRRHQSKFHLGSKDESLRPRNGPQCFEQLVKGGTDGLKAGNVRAGGLILAEGLNEGIKVPCKHKEKHEQEWCSRHLHHKLSHK